jgi:2-methylfumaryl-CoA isomerase
MYRLLDGLKVVELSAFIAAPFCGNTLAQLGAQVTRIDPPEGGLDFRRWPLAPEGGSLYWTGLNHAKRSVTADLASEHGRAFVTALAASSGVVVTNLSPAWLDFDTLRALRPDIILATLDGARDGGTAVDYTVQAASGLPLLNGAEPVNSALPAWDLIAGLTLATAILAAERRRARTGEGAWIRLTLEDVMLSTMATLGFTGEVESAGKVRPPLGNHLYGTFGRDFITRDGARLMLVAITLRQWRALVAATGLGVAVAALEQARGLDLTEEGARYAARERIAALLQGWFAQKDMDAVRGAFAGTAVCWRPYRTLEELAAPGGPLDGNPIFQTVDHPDIGPLRTAGPPFTLDGEAREPTKPASRLGADTPGAG